MVNAAARYRVRGHMPIDAALCNLAAMLRLSVPDQSAVRQGVTPRDALLETVEFAKRVDALGYRRNWLAEALGLKRCA